MNNRSLLSLLALLAAAITLSLVSQTGRSQGGRSQGEEPKGYPWKQTPSKAQSEALEKLQGAWKLVRLTDPSIRGISSDSAVGYVVISGPYLAVEIHVGRRSRLQNQLIPAIRTGMHLMRIDGTKLELSSLIGTFVDEDGRARAEQPGEDRSFEFFITSNQLTLSRSDGYQLLLQRMVHAGARYDVYGRELKRDDEGKDDEDEDKKPDRKP